MHPLVVHLREAWATHLRVTRRYSDARQYRAFEQVFAESSRALAQTPQAVEELRALLVAEPVPDPESSAGDPDAFTSFVRSLLTPNPVNAHLDPDAFRGHVAVGFSAAELPIVGALTAVRDAPSDREMGSDPDPAEVRAQGFSWTGGAAVVPPSVSTEADASSWPVNADGEPLELLLQLDLREGFGLFREEFLPRRGVLQLFHDLETHGELEDLQRDGWAVRWVEVDVEETDAVPLVVAPANAGLGAIARVVIEEITTVPAQSPLDLPDDAARARYERVQQFVEYAGHTKLDPFSPDYAIGPSPWDGDALDLPPLPRIGGHSALPANADYDQVIGTVLPLIPGDEHVLLAEINGFALGHPEWFHGGGTVQYWMRASDLRARTFDNAWAMTRK